MKRANKQTTAVRPRIKGIKDYPGYYVSDSGVVYGKRDRKPLSPYKVKGGYLRVHLGGSHQGQSKQLLVHRLVAEAFVPNPDGKPFVNHKDENKENNSADNLEWVTFAENINYGTRNERASRARGKKVRNIETGEVFNSLKEAGKTIKASSCHITTAARNHNRTCGGFHWEYVEEGE